MPEQDRQVLSGIRVLDLSRWVAGEYATKLFADFGADVVKVERPGAGSLTRAWGPFPDDLPDPERSALFLHLNTNKRSVALDLRDEDDRAVLLRLAREADAVVESFRPGHLESLGLGPDVLRAVNPRLVVTRISAFGQTGPHRDREATGLVLQAAGGPMHATGAADRPPLRKPGLLEHYTVGRSSGEATLAAVLRARRTGRGATIDVSGQEVLLAGADRRASYLLSTAYSGWIPPRGARSPHRHGPTFTGPFRAADGFVMVYVTNLAFWNRLVEIVGADDAGFRERYLDRQTVMGEDREAFMAFVADWVAARPKIEVMERAEAARVPVTALLSVSEVLAHPHYRERGAFVAADHPVAGRLEYAGAPWRMERGFALRSTAPILDQHGDQVRTRGWLEGGDRGDAAPAGDPGRDGDLPLAGVRVVDLTVVWSGPGATTLLGDLGAEVIRTEGNDRLSRQVSAKVTKAALDASGYHGGTYPGGDPGERPYDRYAVFNWHARNKLSVCMNIDTPEGRRAFLDLVAVSDVLVENNSRGVLEKLGLGHERLLEVNPRLVVARMPPLGLTGPMSDYLGYGPNFNSLVGIAAMDGYEGEGPDTAGENYHMDEAAPAGLAFAVLAALWERERTGRGGLIEFCQAENVMAEIGELMIDHQMNGRDPAVLGNTDPHVLQDVFAVAGEDRWVAISIRDDRDWAAAVGVVDTLSAVASLGATAEGRREHSRRLREAIGRWCTARKADDVVAALQGAGIPAAEVKDEAQVLEDPHLAARGWFRERTHPAVGTHRYPGHPWRADDFTLRHDRPLPGFGEDNEHVYLDVLRYDRAAYDDLVARGLVSDHQIA